MKFYVKYAISLNSLWDLPPTFIACLLSRSLDILWFCQFFLCLFLLLTFLYLIGCSVTYNFRSFFKTTPTCHEAFLTPWIYLIGNLVSWYKIFFWNTKMADRSGLETLSLSGRTIISRFWIVILLFYCIVTVQSDALVYHFMKRMILTWVFVD